MSKIYHPILVHFGLTLYICRSKYSCTNMQQYARPRYIAKQAKICKLYAQICTNMQYMQSRISYAEYARICTPHFADVVRYTTKVRYMPLAVPVATSTTRNTLPLAVAAHGSALAGAT